MTWNWEQKDWPEFSYDDALLQKLEARFLQQSGMLTGILRHIDEKEKNALAVDLTSEEAIKTSKIEGEVLNRDSVQSSIRRQLGLETGQSSIPPAEQGIAEMRVNLHSTFAEPLSQKMLFFWHQQLMSGRTDLSNVGAYRTHSDPMQVVSGPLHRRKVHFEAPPSDGVSAEMKKFIRWFNNSQSLPALTRAGIGHLYFLSIHPFEDGNGRIGRALVEKMLWQTVGHPILIALSTTIEKNRKAYYDMLERSNKRNDITSWLLYFSQTILESVAHTQSFIEFLVEKTKFYDRFRDQFNPRQEKVIRTLFAAGADGFKNGLSAEKYIRITGTSRATATRDLQELVSLGALTRQGELKSTRYFLNL